MNRSFQRSRPPSRRTPLGDATSKANSLNPPYEPKSRRSPVKKRAATPRDQSPTNDSRLDVGYTMDASENRRVPKASSNTEANSNRNSANSGTSTSGTARKRKTHVGPWQLGQTIGKGGTSSVREVRHSITGQTAVAKIISKAMAEKVRAVSMANLAKLAEEGDPSLVFGKSIPVGLEREMTIMKLLNHKNIVRLYDVWENRNELYLIMEYVDGGELFDIVAKHQRLKEELCVFLFRQIVAALLYCHRVNIHHRDLKPENILLEQGTLTVKLADFGMAALQPSGNLLTTPCGSPHYAAPELLFTKSYDGAQADVWSCGVVLFVMLTGYPPFNYPTDRENVISEDKKLKILFQNINRADYQMPSNLSLEAQDLIRRIFVVDPKQRITMTQIWQHPFFHKYDATFDLNPHRHIESLIGPTPKVNSWQDLSPKKIDRELFRSLRTLWHSETEATLIRRLCSQEANHEKFFYAALKQHREDHMESMHCNPTSISHSASDYQHAKRYVARGGFDVPPGMSKELRRTMSGFNVGSTRHLASQHSFYDIAKSEASYDPFRASREPLNPQSNYMNVTVHRGSSSGSRKPISRGPTPSIRTSSLKADTFRKDSRRRLNRMSRVSDASNSLRAPSTQHLSVTGRVISRSPSRMSVNSSQWLSSPPVISRRPSDLHKRAVQFSHLRRSSTASALKARAGSDGVVSSHSFDVRARSYNFLSPSSPPRSSPPRSSPARSSHARSSPAQSSPALESHSIVRSKKARLPDDGATPSTRKMKDIDREARKVSTELREVCEEAFFRQSLSSSVRTSITEKHDACETPPSSLFNRSSTGARKGAVLDRSILNRPLPPTPPMMDTMMNLQMSETPSAYTARELAEMRARLATVYEREGASNQEYFNAVLRQLDRLMPVGRPNHRGGEGKRTVSAPDRASSFFSIDEQNHLHVIPEEERFADAEMEPSLVHAERSGRLLRSVTEPQKGNKISRNLDPTIRLVHNSSPPPPPPPSPPPWTPLVIRKQSNNSSISEEQRGNMAQTANGDDLSIPKFPSEDLDAITSDLPSRHRSAQLKSVSRSANQAGFRSKDPSPGRSFDGLDERTTRRDDRAASLTPVDAAAEVNPPEEMKKNKIKGLMSIFKKKKTVKFDVEGEAESDTKGANFVDQESDWEDLEVVAHSVDQQIKRKDRDLYPNTGPLHTYADDQWNSFKQVLGFHWLPASHVEALIVNDVEFLKRIMVHAKHYPGITIKTSKKREEYWHFTAIYKQGLIKGLDMPVTFDVEAFQINQYDLPSMYSLVRITQTSGSASSLRKIAKELTEWLWKRDMVVRDRKLHQELCGTLKLGLLRSEK